MARNKHNSEPAQRILTAALIAIGVISLLAIVLRFVSMGLHLSGDLEHDGSWWWGITAVNCLELLLYAIIALLVYFIIMFLRASLRTAQHSISHLERIESLLQQQREELGNIASLASLSDQAKSLIYYDRELEAVRENVHAMLLQQDYESAEAMITRMESRLGLTDEATRLREDIESGKNASVDEKIAVAIERIHSILDRRDWTRAKREAERLLALFPNKPQIASLPQQIQAAWSAYKRKLLQDYGEACRINDVERSIDLLRELDKYLTPQEGAALAESARDVFKKKLHNLGVQFAIAVADQQWANAVGTGEEIIRGYPNSRMAREVREKLDLLRDYSTGVRQPGSGSIIDQPGSPFSIESPAGANDD